MKKIEFEIAGHLGPLIFSKGEEMVCGESVGPFVAVHGETAGGVMDWKEVERLRDFLSTALEDRKPARKLNKGEGND